MNMKDKTQNDYAPAFNFTSPPIMSDIGKLFGAHLPKEHHTLVVDLDTIHENYIPSHDPNFKMTNKMVTGYCNHDPILRLLPINGMIEGFNKPCPSRLIIAVLLLIILYFYATK